MKHDVQRAWPTARGSRLATASAARPAFEADADRAPAHRRVRLVAASCRANLVASRVEGAERTGRRRACHPRGKLARSDRRGHAADQNSVGAERRPPSAPDPSSEGRSLNPVHVSSTPLPQRLTGRQIAQHPYLEVAASCLDLVEERRWQRYLQGAVDVRRAVHQDRVAGQRLGGNATAWITKDRNRPGAIAACCRPSPPQPALQAGAILKQSAGRCCARRGSGRPASRRRCRRLAP